MTPASSIKGLSLMAVALGGIAFCALAYGHALQPGYLELRLVDEGHYAIVWKKPSSAGRPMAIDAVLPENCEPRSAARSVWDGNAYLARWNARCPGGLEGGVIRIEGLERTATDVLVRFDLAGGGTETRRLTADNASFTVPVQPGSFQVAGTYLVYGIEHILLGIDHLLFVLALLLLVKGVGRIVATVTAFTLAHSLTLAGATLGVVNVPGPPVEAVIALSIAFVAAEIVHGRRGRPGLTERYPWIVAFTFGLLHGFGFASALAEVGLPRNAIPISLLFFNIGVEIGQLLFIGSVFAMLALARYAAPRIESPRPQWALTVPPYLIGSLAAFWVIQRTAGFLV